MKKIISLAFASLILVNIAVAGNGNPYSLESKSKVVCPTIALSSPPSTLKTGNAKGCSNTLTVSTDACSPYTFTFTGSFTGSPFVQSTASGSPTLNFLLPAMTNGTSITLVITDSGSNSSSPIFFTSSYCAD